MPIQVLMPALSPTMTEGNLVKWHKKEGDQVASGDILAEIETDKATMEVEAVDGGTLARILVAEGSQDVKVNTLIALLLEEDEDASALDGFSAAPVAASAPAPSAAQQGVPQAPSAPAQSAPSGKASPSSRILASPLAKRIASQKGLDLASVTGSGPHGRIIKVDVENARAPTGKAAPVTGADALFPVYEEQTLTNMRKVIAKRLTEAKQTIPHFYLTVDVALDKLLALRADVNETLEKDNRISVNDFVIKAMGRALMLVPEANASFMGDSIRFYKRADISVAVAIEGGLVTPIIRGANEKSLADISLEMKDLAARARAGKLRPEEFQGGTFSLSNLGMFGVKEFGAVINPPQGGILAVGA
ncbi:MAG: pyruvate dehydrogenase complex dihydrolipoamide acetyltransferase, partial [Proteobacteria bacterium]|nr:pyruvate dehydrogenase complex dihydrolipoamide acetyltransferase [Pseudomonadota bacterium]